MANSSYLFVKRYEEEGDLANEYQSLHNKKLETGELTGLDTNELNFDLNNPVNIECQPSYDGSVNLIINDDKNPPRIVNTAFTVLEDNRYKRVIRNQKEQTNLYKENYIDQTTRLFRNIQKFPKIDLTRVASYGQLKGGNYTIYLKLADNDYNKTDIVAESSIISIFNGSLDNISSISGTLAEERTNKDIQLTISNLDESFTKFFIYIKRDYSDLNGISASETYMIKEPYTISAPIINIDINGYEEITEIAESELNIKYNTCNAVKTQAQVQNILFFGNVQQTVTDNAKLQDLSYYIKATYVQDPDLSVGYIDPETYKIQSTDDISQSEYYNPLQIYYHLGY